jgi:RNA polymerase sigma-70 factor (ECF subfamily)
MGVMLAPAIVERCYRRADAADWQVPIESFAEALERSLRKSTARTPKEIERYLDALHLKDLALACACAAGHDAAWERFILTVRPALYRSADAIDSTGGARELADSLYADLYGTSERDGRRQSLFRYFHGRSSLGTWVRAVLAQRHVDRMRQRKRNEPLPLEDSAGVVASPVSMDNPDRPLHVDRLNRALGRALADLAARDRLRLGCYYAQDMTLGEIGRLLNEHEATVSRHLARTRRALRESIETCLRIEERLTEPQIAECLTSLMSDAGPLDLSALLATADSHKEFVENRSSGKRTP